MKLELKENMYVRTNDGYINKIKKVNQFNVLVDGRDLFGEELNIPNNEITKVSYNIIDILECGDIISFYEDIDNYKKQYVIGIPDLITLDKIKDKITNDNIRLVSILTKEKMGQMAYKVGE